MRIIYNNILPFRGFCAVMIFGVIFARKKYDPLSARALRHECIHLEQARESGGYLIYYIKYLFFAMRYGYVNNPFEREAYEWDIFPKYLEFRERNRWKLYK